VLSQGQRRHRARAARNAPRPLWILDEPATALDASGTELSDGSSRAISAMAASSPRRTRRSGFRRLACWLSHSDDRRRPPPLPR
jgi:hypothetical protein